MAQQGALAAKHRVAVNATRSHAMAAIPQAMMDVSGMMQAHPRYGRLMRLAIAKEACSGNF